MVKEAGDAKPTTRTFTLEEAEGLATTNWGGGDACGSAKDIWKELVYVGAGGKAGTGKAGGGGGGGAGGAGAAGPAVRLRLRFVPLWDCLVVRKGGPNAFSFIVCF